MGEAWRRARAASYAQQEDRARHALLRPTLERLWTSSAAERELICLLSVPCGEVVAGTDALLLLRDGSAPVVICDASEVGELDPASTSLLRETMARLGPAAANLNVFEARVVRVGKFSNACTIVLRRPSEVSDDAA